MPELTMEVRLRDDVGRYIELANEAGYDALREMVETTAHFAAEGAPVGPARKDYGRRPKLDTSIHPVEAGKVGYVRSDAGHALSQEQGARPHLIPNAFGMGGAVMHPGNAPQPFMRPALQRLRPLIPGILRRAYARLG